MRRCTPQWGMSLLRRTCPGASLLSALPSLHAASSAASTVTATAAPSTTPTCLQTSHRSFCSYTAITLARRIRGGSRRARVREPAKGDWLCQCGELNYRAKRECFKCGAPAPPLPPGVRRPTLPGEDPHDWACPCGQMNFRGSVVCHKCQQPKPEPPPMPGKEITLWTCPKCKGLNRSNRKFCFKCAAPSPLMEFKPLQ